MDEDDRADEGTNDTPQKSSRRDRFKGALARTRSKFKKDKPEANVLSDDVDDFLAAGRTSTSSQNARSLGQDSLPYHPTPGFHTSAPATDPNSPRPSTSDSSSFTHSKQSPKKVNVPRIDVSTSQRYPDAQPIGTSNVEDVISDFLRPAYQNRSQSASSLAKSKRRARGLSVSFVEAPPLVIGIGGDDAPAPPVEISKARARARSVSPMRNRSQPNDPVYTPNQQPHPSNAPTGLHKLNTHGPHPSPPDILRPRGLQRIQTGLSPVTPVGTSSLDQEFEMTLQKGAGAKSPSTSSASPATPEIHAPRPIRPVKPPPAVMEVPEPHVLKKESPSGDLRSHFREGDALRMHMDEPGSDPSNEVSPQSVPSSGVSPNRNPPDSGIGPNHPTPSRWL